MTEVEYINSIKLYEDRVFGFILKQTKNKDLSQEIVQEAFLKLWVNKAKVEILKAKSWLFTTAYNHMINMLKIENRYNRQTTDNPYNNIDIDYSGNDISFPHKIENQRSHNTIEDFNRTDIIRTELKKLKIPADDDCVLWLWVTNSFMEVGYELLKEWGFEHKTILTWNKVNKGMGNYLGNVTEHCIIAVKGKPISKGIIENKDYKYSTLITEKRSKHSTKPEIFYTMVDEICAGRKLDYFARKKRKGWDVYGDEVQV